MPLASSRLTRQGQISVPAVIRNRLGIGPGAVLEWDEAEGRVWVRRAGRFSSQDIHDVLFPDAPPAAKSLAALKEGPKLYVKRRHARR